MKGVFKMKNDTLINEDIRTLYREYLEASANGDIKQKEHIEKLLLKKLRATEKR